MLLSLPNLPGPDRRGRGRGAARGRRVREDGPQPRGAARQQPRHGGRRKGVGLALRLPQGPAGAARAGARAVGALAARGARLHSRDPAGARARAGARRHGHAARHRAADLPRARGRALPGGHLGGPAGVPARGRDPRRGRAAAALRRLLALLPARGRGGRQGHAGPVPRAPVREGRDVLVRGARGVAGRARAAARRSRRRSSRRSGSRTAS